MKLNFFKQGIPVAVFALAIAGAFTTNAMEKRSRAAALVTAYPRLNPAGTCSEEPYTCESINNFTLCRVNQDDSTSAQLYSKDANGNCTIQTYKPD